MAAVCNKINQIQQQNLLVIMFVSTYNLIDIATYDYLLLLFSDTIEKDITIIMLVAIIFMNKINITLINRQLAGARMKFGNQAAPFTTTLVLCLVEGEAKGD